MHPLTGGLYACVALCNQTESALLNFNVEVVWKEMKSVRSVFEPILSAGNCFEFTYVLADEE